MKDEILKLVTLHQMDRDLLLLEEELVERQATIEKDRARLKAAHQQFDVYKEDLRRKQLESASIDEEIKSMEQRYKEYNYQLLKMKDAKTYDTVSAQLQDLRETISVRENDGIQLLGEIDEFKEKLQRYEEKLSNENSRIEELEQELEILKEERKPQMEELRQKRDSYAGAVKEIVLEQYEHLLNLPDKKPLAALDGRTCTGCFSDVTLESVQQVKMQEKVINCPTCGRILYYPDMVGKSED